MKNSSIDGLYDRITRHMIRQRRLISILLVLSILVSSGVLWGLHDTGITMANDAECGIEEHIHTDECYAEVLVCGYDDNGETYDDTLNYQYVCACGLEEGEDHTHGPECYEFVYAKDKGQDEAEAETEGTEDEEMPVTERIVNGVSAAVIPEDEEEAEVEEEKTADTDETDEDQGTDEHKGVKHIHTENCYGRAVVCGIEEHIHRYSCYFGEVPEEEDEDFGLIDDSKVVMLNSLMDDEDEDVEFFDASEMSVGAASELPPEITTVDNIAEGIKINLFDYFGPELEASNNNYDIRWIEKEDQPKKDSAGNVVKDDDGNIVYEEVTVKEWQHRNYKTLGINTGRNPNDDIMFFAYGTPDFTGRKDNSDYRRNTILVDNDDGTKKRIYTPSKNNYSGDYYWFEDPTKKVFYNRDGTVNEEAHTDYEKVYSDKINGTITDYFVDPGLKEVISGNRPVQGIVNKTLGSDGYPVMNNAASHSLSYLFKPENVTDQKEVWEDVNHILKKDDSYQIPHLVFDSNDNYAYFNKETKDFTVYDDTYYIINKDHHFANDYNELTDETYQTANGYPFKIGFFPFDQYDDTRRDPNFNGNGFNHHFGMTMEASFINQRPVNVTEPIMFSYSGDDDMWVYVDGKLVLDVGGIHEPAAGMIDFTNGLVWIQDNYLGKSWDELGYTDAKYARPKNYDGIRAYDKNGNEIPGSFTATKWIVTSIKDYLGNDWTPGKKHDIKMFYLERGGCYSNLAMDMNLPTLKKLVVSKDVDKGEMNDNYFDNMEYKFRVMEVTDNGLVPANLGNGISNEFTLKNGDRRIFEDLDGTKRFLVEEYDVDTGIFKEVKINDVNKLDGSSAKDSNILSEVSLYQFTNVIKEEYTELKVKKEWEDATENKNHSDAVIKFKIYRTDSMTPEAAPKVVSIDNTRTFRLENNNGVLEKTFTKLPKQYGNHVYSYSVVEQNVPMGYKVSYSTDENGTLIIKNTDIHIVDINVKKEWENVAEGNEPNVTLTLRRKSVGYSESERTYLKVRVLDESGSLIGEFENGNVDVYAGGSVEFSLNNGVEFYQIATPFDKNNENVKSTYVCDPPSLGFSYADGYFEISKLEKRDESNPNTVTIKVDTNNINDSITLLHHSFTQSKCGWVAQGPAPGNEEGFPEVACMTSGRISYAKNDGLLIQNRSKSWNGAKLQLDPMIFKANKTYSFSVYAYAEKATTFIMTFNDGLDKENNRSFQRVSTQNASAGSWTQLTGYVTLPEDINPYGMYILIETNALDDDQTTDIEEFRIDEFIAVEGSKYISVSQGSGQVTIGERSSVGSGGSTSSVVYEDDGSGFSNDKGGWSGRQGASAIYVAPDGWGTNNPGKPLILANGRKYQSSGAQKSLPDLIPGREYSFTINGGGNVDSSKELYVKDGQSPSGEVSNYVNNNNYAIDMKATLYTGVAGNDEYMTIGSSSFKGYGNFTITGTVTVPAGANPSDIKLYIENTNKLYKVETYEDTKDGNKLKIGYHEDPSGSNNWVITKEEAYPQYRLYSYKVETNVPENTEPLEPKFGYDIVGDRYVSNNSQFGITFDENSATNPLHLNGDYEPETWGKTINLPIIDGDKRIWDYHWGTTDLDEDNTRLYQYYVEETGINLQEYKVTCFNDGVATNTADTPIIVHNKYIWYRLPATGGSGTTIYFIGGITFIILGLSGALVINRRRRKNT